MKHVIYLFLLLNPLIWQSPAFSQSYTTNSKSCGSCGKAVSVNSTIGMRCPHCGVRWGYENEKRTTSTRRYSNNYNDDSYSKSSGTTKSVVNLRSLPSTKSSILAKIPAYTTLSIISKMGDWYYVKYSYYSEYFPEEVKGYVYKTLIQ